jgi:two-component system, OmpR family, response regulator
MLSLPFSRLATGQMYKIDVARLSQICFNFVESSRKGEKMAKVLFAEDEKALSDVVIDWLESQQFLVDHVDNGREAMDRLKFYEFDVVILDWNLPEMDGVDILRQYRASGGTTPVLMLTGKRELDDKEEGFAAGADDYLTKPFKMRELTMRLKALLRRPAAFTETVLKARDISLDPTTHRVTKGEAELILKPKEFALLEFLLRHPGEVFTSEALIERVWPTVSDASPNTIRTYVNRIRNKVDTSDQESLISTVHGIRYRLDP